MIFRGIVAQDSFNELHNVLNIVDQRNWCFHHFARFFRRVSVLRRLRTAEIENYL